MLRTILALAAIAAAGRFAAAQESSSSMANVPNCYVAVAEQANLPPLEAGVIREVAVKEGDEVTEGQLLVQLDDSKVVQEQKVAEAKYNAAKAKAEDDINIRYAIEASKVADAAYQVNLEANRRVPGSVPIEKLRELDLERTKNRLGIEKSKLEQEVAVQEALVAKAELEAAKVTVSRHKVLSPINGVVNEIAAHKGEAVQPNQAVIHVVNLDNVWVEGRVSAASFARAELVGQKVTAHVALPHHSEKVPLTGVIVFVRPLTDNGGTYVVRAKVNNRKVDGSWISPGTQADMDIELRRLP
jgi:multidrug resistance efflux pump